MLTAALILLCAAPAVHDGDSLRCNNVRVRLIGIDAPELADSPRCHDARKAKSDCDQTRAIASRDYLRSLTRGEVRCTVEAQDRYGRALARCSAGGTDLSAAMIEAGHAEAYGTPKQ